MYTRFIMILLVCSVYQNIYAQNSWKGKWIWLNNRQFPNWQRTKSDWINPPGPKLKPYRALFRKNFYIDRLPEQGSLFMTADVRFRVYINGSLAAEGPDNTGGDYGDEKSPSYWYYSSYDVRNRLKVGMNTISVEVFAWALESSDVTSSFGRLIGELRNGDTYLVATDTSWKANIDSSYSYSNDFLQYDADKEAAGWKTNSFADNGWAPASFQHAADSTRLYQSHIPGQMHYPVQPVRLFEVKAAANPIGDEISPNKFYGRKVNSSGYILDFGKNMAAHISFTVVANIGDTLEITSYEKMGSNPVAGRKYRYLCKKGSNIFSTPNISPFRYLRVRVSTRAGLVIQQFDADFCTYPVQYMGSFSCSNPFYNQLWSIIRYTAQLCMSDMFFDSPMHQEPIGCTGDYFIESMNSYYAFGDHWLTRQNLIQTAQMMEKNDYKMFHTSYSLIWVQMLRQYVQFTGDTALLYELLPHADKLMDRFKGYLNKDWLVADAPNYMFMDWITIKGYNAHHPPAMIGMGYMSAMLYKAMRDIDDMRDILGRNGHYPRYTATADSIRMGINKILWDPARKLYRDGIPFLTVVPPSFWLPADSNMITYSPHVNTLAVLYDIAPPDAREGIMNYVVTQQEYELQPYFMSYVLGAVQNVGWHDKGLELIDRWRKGIDTSTYTLKENWRDKTDFGYGGDFSHAWGGAPLRWLSGNVLGISPESPGYAPIAIRPYTGDQLNWAKGAVPVGDEKLVLASWEKKSGRYYFEYTIPAGKTGHFYIPASLEEHEWMVDGRRHNESGPILLAAGKHIIIERSGDSSSDRKKDEILPTPQQAAWADKEIGVIIHLDINVFAKDTFDYHRKETLPPLSVFHPSKLNTDQWIASAKAAGATYAVLVAKHGTGFSLWPTKAHGYNVSGTPYKNGKGDIVADFIKSCKKYGLQPGIYCNTNVNSYYGVDFDIPFASDEAHKAYNKMVLQQLTELWSQYGKLFEIWFDGGIVPDEKGGIADEVNKLIKEYQPEAILFQGPRNSPNLIRWVGNENGEAPYPMWSRADTTTSSNGLVQINELHGNPDGKIWCPAESDFPNRKNDAWNGGWLWKANQQNYLFSVNELVDKYYKSVGRNTNMLIGMAIDTSGQFPQEDAKRFEDFGNEIQRRFGKSIAETQGSGKEIVLNISNTIPVKINHIILMEDNSKGENIRKYQVEAWQNGTWNKIADGISIGHKIIQRFDTIATTKIRLTITESSAQPVIKKLAVYYVQ